MKTSPRHWICMLALAFPSSVFGAAAPGSKLFSETEPIPAFKIEIAERELLRLTRANRSYVTGTVTVGEEVFKNVGVRLKGQGSFQPINQKPSLALKFDQFTPHQKFFGLSKILLNNSVQDSSLFSEYLCTGLFREAGVPAARVTHARVHLNGRDLGFYVLIEAMNKTFLRQHFTNANGNLYEGYAQDIDHKLENDSGPPSNQSDLSALVNAAALSPSQRMPRLHELLDVDRFFSFLAVSVMIAQHDSYPFNRNNYRIYHDPTSRQFVMIAHGIDGTFRDNNISIRPPAKYILTKAVLERPEDRLKYRETFGDLFTNVFKMDVITNRLAKASMRLQAAALADTERVKIAERTTNFLRRISQRHYHVAKQLAQPEPSRIRVEAGQEVQLTGWEPEVDEGTATMEEQTFDDHSVLYVKTGFTLSLGVWRMRALLDPGRYRVTGRVQTTNASQQGSSLNGAAVRTFKMYAAPRRIISNDTWTNATHPFVVAPGDEEIEFVCELRAVNAEARFDAASIKLLRE